MDKELIEELKEWNAKVETEHEEMINEYENRIDKLERALIEEDWKHRQLPKQIVLNIKKQLEEKECTHFEDEFEIDYDYYVKEDVQEILDNLLKDCQGDGE